MACIVSHDISLATKYADIIYLLTPSDGDSSESHYELKSVNCFERAARWLNFDGKLIEDNELESHLHQALQAYFEQAGFHFGKKELQAIAGRRTWGRKVVWLLLISVGQAFCPWSCQECPGFSRGQDEFEVGPAR